MSKRVILVAVVAFAGLTVSSAAKAQAVKFVRLPTPYASGLSYVTSTGKVIPVPRRPAGVATAPAAVYPQGKSHGLSYVNLFTDQEQPVPRRPPQPYVVYPYGKPKGLSVVTRHGNVEVVKPYPRRPSGMTHHSPSARASHLHSTHQSYAPTRHH